jgi:ArsR family transcriptional regulator, arsenate/arsenite/antimonite-responsive transcriptional repressor
MIDSSSTCLPQRGAARCYATQHPESPASNPLDLTIPPDYISVIGEIAKYILCSIIASMNAVFQALGDPTRREILRLLRKREMTAGELADQFSLARSTLSGHFNILKHAGLIVAEKNGTSIVYSLNVSVVEQAMAAMMDLLDVGKSSKKGKS